MSKRGQMPEPKRAGQFVTVRQIRGAARAAGSHWFDPDTMAAFGSRVHQKVYAGRLFVSSERDPWGAAWDGERRYTVREALPDGSIATVGEFGAFRTAREAHAAAAAIARQVTP